MTTTALDKRKKLRLLGQLLVDGKDDEEICKKLCVEGPDSLAELLEIYHAEQIEKIKRRSPERNFADYLTKQSQGIRTLDQLIGDLRAAKTGKFTPAVAAAVVSAVKARADLLDRIEARGIQCGLFPKEIEQKLIRGIDVSKLTPAQLKGAIFTQVQDLSALVEFEDVALGELEPGDIYRDDLPPIPTAARRKQRTKRAAGRKVVKTTLQLRS